MTAMNPFMPAFVGFGLILLGALGLGRGKYLEGASAIALGLVFLGLTVLLGVQHYQALVQ